MDLEEISVNTRKLSTDKTDIEGYLSTIRKELDTMVDDVDALSKMWIGTASFTFNRAFSSDIAFLRKICDDIQEVIDFEATAISEYNSCEQKISQLIADISLK